MARFPALALELLDRPARRRMILVAAGGLLVAGLEALGLVLLVPLVQVLTQANGAIPPSARWVADRLNHPSSLGVAGVLALVIFVAFVVKGVASLLILRWSIGVILRDEAHTSRQLLCAYLGAPYAFHIRRNSADLQRTVHDDLRRVYEDALVAAVGGFADAVVIAVVVVVLFVIEPIVAGFAAAYFAVVGVGYQRLIHGKALRAGEVLHHEIEHAYRVVQQSVDAVKEVQISHSARHFGDELFDVKGIMASRLRTLVLLFQAPRYYLEIALIIGVGALATAVYNLRSVSAATAILGLFLAAGFRLLPSLNRVLVALSAMKAALPALERVTNDLAELGNVDYWTVEAGELVGSSQLAFDHVSFEYEAGSPPILKDISLQIAPGSFVAFVGASGAGKTTLLNLVLGLLSPTSGRVTVGGKPMGDVLHQWHGSIGYVPQDVVLLDTSLRENIGFGLDADEIDNELLESAVLGAQLGGFVSELPAGLGTRVAEHGARLSGGQRQRVGIARALYRRPNVLILDEATSALDAETEHRISDTIDALKGELTLITVTHRLATVRNCDVIHVLEDGDIVAVGSFDELLESSSTFASLARLSGINTTGSDRAVRTTP